MLMTVTLWLSVFSLRLNFVNAVECDEMIIRYDPQDLNRLTHCTAILGSLTIMSLEDRDNLDSINTFKFPKLK